MSQLVFLRRHTQRRELERMIFQQSVRTSFHVTNLPKMSSSVMVTGGVKMDRNPYLSSCSHSSKGVIKSSELLDLSNKNEILNSIWTQLAIRDGGPRIWLNYWPWFWDTSVSRNKLIIAFQYFGSLISADCHDFSTQMGALFIG